MEKTLRGALKYRWFIFTVLALQYLFVYFHRVCPAVVAEDLVETFSISATSLGILASGYFYPYALMQVPVGLLADSWGSRKTIVFFSLVASVGSLMFSLSPSFGVATVSRVVVGFGLSGIFVPAMKVLAQWFRPGEYARISGALMAVGGLGWLFAATPLAVVTKAFGWRTGFIAIGVITLAFTVLGWFFVADSPRRKGFPDVDEHHAPAGTGGNIGVWEGVKLISTTPAFWPLAVWSFCNGSVLFSFNGLWAGPYLRDIYGLSKPAIGNILSMVAIGMVVGSPFLGYLSDSLLKSRKKVIMGCSVVMAAEWAYFYLFFQSIPLALMYVLFFIIGVCLGSSIVIAFTASKELFPLPIVSTSVAAVNLFGFVGGIIYQPLVGHFMDVGGKVGGRYLPGGYKSAFLLFLATGILFLISSLFVKEKRTR